MELEWEFIYHFMNVPDWNWNKSKAKRIFFLLATEMNCSRIPFLEYSTFIFIPRHSGFCVCFVGGGNMRNCTPNESEPFGIMSKKAHMSWLRLCAVNWTLLMGWPQRLGLFLWCDSFYKSFQGPKYHKILSQKPSFQRMCVSAHVKSS